MNENKNNKRLALCIPAYNAANYLSRLLMSAKKQLISFDEILVYNDCSTDKTEEVALKYGAKVINGDINRGCSFGKNKLTEISCCDWLHFHDADDDLLPNFTALAHQWMNKPDNADVVLFNYEYRDNETKKLLSTRNFNDDELKLDPIKYAILNQINPFCGLYRKKALLQVGGYDIDPAILYNEDVAFHCKLALNKLTFRAEKEVSIINYYVHNSMSASNQLKCAQAHHHVMKRVAEQVEGLYNFEIAKKLWGNAIICASLNDSTTAMLSSQMAYKLYPKVINDESFVVKYLSKFNPLWGIMFREKLIRIFKPHLRK
jgi:glycosyltransferase involved in cell wall biosynthesis